MRWFRINRQWGGRLALFALALQLVLSFGHIHAEDLGLAAPAAITHAQSGTAGGGAPSPHDRGDTHDVCAICATLNLTATSLVPLVAALALPAAHDWVWSAAIAAPPARFDLARSFQARAPPLA
jgi:hypothetical protein